MAAYMRFKYPNIVSGALSASCPFGWVAGSGDFHEFFEVITKDFNDENPQCVDIVRQGFLRIQVYAALGQAGDCSCCLNNGLIMMSLSHETIDRYRIDRRVLIGKGINQ